MYERTQLHKDIISEALKRWNRTHVHPMKGKKLGIAWNYGLSHTKETKQRISISMKEWWLKPGIKERMIKAAKHRKKAGEK